LKRRYIQTLSAFLTAALINACGVHARAEFPVRTDVQGGLSLHEIQKVIDEADARRDEMLRAQIEAPYPRNGTWHYADFALAAFYLNQRVDEANAAILHIRKVEFPQDLRQGNFHWRINLLQRIYWFFNHRSKYFPGRLSPAAERSLVEMFWEWAKPWCKIEYAEPERTWWIWGSENHGAMAWSGFWGTAEILSTLPEYRNRRYDDGTTVVQMAKAWDAFYLRYARERAAKGLLVECGSPTYTKYTLQGWYNMVDFALDPVLRKRMRMLLDLYWADWAVEQIDGIRGGSRHRCYPGRASIEGSDGAGLCWFHFGLGHMDKHPAFMCGATSTYRPLPCVVDMALDVPGRGTYVYRSRRPGLNLLPRPKADDWTHYILNPDYGGILRYTYCTPDFVMGTSMVEPRPYSDWTAISSQNRWDGVIFAGNPKARIFVQPLQPQRGSFYNPHWSVQDQGVLIVQKLRTNRRARGQRVWFGEGLTRSEQSGWVFAEAPSAYAAVRVVTGGTRWEPDSEAQHREKNAPLGKGMWLACEDPYSPIIIEVARKCDFRTLAAFQRSIISNALALEHGVLRYRSRLYGADLTFYTQSARLPEVNGNPINFRPSKVYDCPFIQSEWGSGVVVLRKGARKTVLDFNAGGE